MCINDGIKHATMKNATMKTEEITIAFGAVTAFEVRCKSAASRACRRAMEWQVAEAKPEMKKALPNVMELFRQLRRPVDQASRLECEMTPNEVAGNAILERSS